MIPENTPTTLKRIEDDFICDTDELYNCLERIGCPNDLKDAKLLKEIADYCKSILIKYHERNLMLALPENCDPNRETITEPERAILSSILSDMEDLYDTTRAVLNPLIDIDDDYDFIENYRDIGLNIESAYEELRFITEK